MLRRTTLAKPGERRGSASVCPFDFSFDSHGDALEPLHPLHHGEGALPSFHRWARRFPVRIDNKILQGISLPEEAADLSQTMKAALRAALTHRDQRPSSARLCEMLDGLETECEEKSPLEGTFVWANGTPDLERQTSVARSQSLARRPSGSVARGVPGMVVSIIEEQAIQPADGALSLLNSQTLRFVIRIGVPLATSMSWINK